MVVCIHAGVVIGFEQTMVAIQESDGVVELCAVIRDGSLERSVDVTFSTQPGTAQGSAFVYVLVM